MWVIGIKHISVLHMSFDSMSCGFPMCNLDTSIKSNSVVLPVTCLDFRTRLIGSLTLMRLTFEWWVKRFGVFRKLFSLDTHWPFFHQPLANEIRWLLTSFVVLVPIYKFYFRALIFYRFAVHLTSAVMSKLAYYDKSYYFEPRYNLLEDHT